MPFPEPARWESGGECNAFVVYVAIVSYFLSFFLFSQDIQRVIVTGCQYAYSYEICP